MAASRPQGNQILDALWRRCALKPPPGSRRGGEGPELGRGHGQSPGPPPAEGAGHADSERIDGVVHYRAPCSNAATMCRPRPRSARPAVRQGGLAIAGGHFAGRRALTPGGGRTHPRPLSTSSTTMLGDVLFGLLLRTQLAASAAIVLVFLMRPWARWLIGPRLAYRLWAIPVAALAAGLAPSITTLNATITSTAGALSKGIGLGTALELWSVGAVACLSAMSPGRSWRSSSWAVAGKPVPPWSRRLGRASSSPATTPPSSPRTNAASSVSTNASTCIGATP